MRPSYVPGFLCPAGPQHSEIPARASQGMELPLYVQDPPTIAAGLGVTHTFDLQAIFGLNYGGSVSSSMRDINAAIIPVVMHYYISFRHVGPESAQG
ncbi:hypothetical protein CNMCM5793_008742 [Aspergillus hiratsukae]|uniref:Uncharacterized protein n=1 Tax=Aspergillus hiratsukae TaxID=1194566 RepID=A0A8H6UKQ9_9EURO|nr:hypothetical protein CNMCM5793_008742 [Aspergillus hiratsukae]KAF7157992.1 hypothetical protein CNMCM6106_004281 [Aspergillus hiratsukae]